MEDKKNQNNKMDVQADGKENKRKTEDEDETPRKGEKSRKRPSAKESKIAKMNVPPGLPETKR